MIIQMQATERGSRAMMRDDGSRKLLMKTMQESLRDGDRHFKSTVTICKVWLGWEENLHKFWEVQFRRKFWEVQFRLHVGKVGMLCEFSRMNS